MIESTFECSQSGHADAVETALAGLHLPVSRRDDTLHVPVPRGVDPAAHQSALSRFCEAIIEAFDSDLFQ